MNTLFDVQTLIWMLPIVFIIHDFEEIIMIEKWLNQNIDTINKKLPKKLADRVIRQFSMTTAQMAVAVLVIFLFVASSTYMASQYVNKGPFGNIYFFMVIILILFIHIFTHIGQTLFFQSITPGVITSVLLLFPYSLILFHSLKETQMISWQIIFVCLPFIFLIFPIVLVAHWLGKKII